jgi:murein DD-endopeptidase MepM/ murein hydrolase activator NlpD
VRTRLQLLGAFVATALLAIATPRIVDADPGDVAVALEQEHERRQKPKPQKPIPERDGVPLDRLFPMLVGWTHPVTGASEITPQRPERRFGARRWPGGGRKCGRGHCGVDLDGPRGRPIVAVAPGTVIHVERRRNGKDGFSGRYVKIEHAGGVLTAYMHLDSVERGLRKGDVIAAGTVIGTLGRSGIRDGDPHLHLSLEIPTKRGNHHRFMDPTPYLQRASVIPDPRAKTDRRLQW